MRRKICVITGSRADYGILYSVMKSIQNSKKLRLFVVSTCMHLMKKFGYTINEIKKDGFKIYQTININYENDTGKDIAVSIGKAVSLFAECFHKLRPDIVVILGDRGEMLAAAIAANYLSIPIAHIHGGELSGHIDGILRHAITKLAHIHFPATKEAEKRILKLGEEKWRVKMVGSPALDRIIKKDYTYGYELAWKYKIDLRKPITIIAYHPTNNEENQMELILKSSEKESHVIVIYPNADEGSKRIIKVIKKYQKLNKIHSYKNIPHRDYLGLLAIATTFIGNSSSAIIEAPLLNKLLKIINIGNRQQGREQTYSGDGKASERIVQILSTIKIDNKLLNKRMTY